MTLDELEAQIAGALWFARCGQFTGESGAVALAVVSSSDDWDWLPTSRDQNDPVHGNTLVAEADALGIDQARRDAELAAARWVMTGLRSVSERLPVLVDGPNDFTPAAKGGAVFAARMAAREILVNRPGLWCWIVQLFVAGFWPCGWYAERNELVVF